MVANISKRSTTELIFFLKDIRASKAVTHQKQQKKFGPKQQAAATVEKYVDFSRTTHNFECPMSTSRQRGKEYFETMQAINPLEKLRNCLKIFNVHKYARKELKLILPFLFWPV